jgi:hypothetical protein
MECLAMIRSSLFAFTCLGLAACVDDFPKDAYDPKHPIDVIYLERGQSTPYLLRVRDNLAALIRPGDGASTIKARFAAFRIDCLEAGALLRCTYLRYVNVVGKGIVQRWRDTYRIEIDARPRASRIQSLCIEFTHASETSERREHRPSECIPPIR